MGFARVTFAAAMSLGIGYLVFKVVFRLRADYLAALYPHDGQIGLDALALAVGAAVVAVVSTLGAGFWLLTTRLKK